MKPIFRVEVEAILKSKSSIVLELGCGKKQNSDRIGIDRLHLPEVDIVADLEDGLPFFPDNSVNMIYSKSVLEHINNLDMLMRDIWRVLKPDGRKYLFVPHFSNPYYYSDYTHKHFFGLYSFEYFSKSQTRFRRKVPNFYHDFSFRTEELTLVFSYPWRTRKLVKRISQRLFNLNAGWQEFYEENFCYIIPCYGIQATLRPEK